jgi:selenide,water dikinase
MTTLNALGRDALRASGGVSSVTDVTGFGLAGHAFEMARGSGLTIELDVSSLPKIEGSESLAISRYRTRASASNRAFVEPGLAIEAGADPLGLEYVFDAQTSGGLLIAIAPDSVDRLLDELRRRESPAAAVVGRVIGRRGDTALVLR